MPTNADAGHIDARPLVRRLRTLCLKFPATSERSSWGHPNFRAGNRTFATFEVITGRPSIAFRLPPDEVDALIRANGFFATPYGRGLWASMWVDGAIDWKAVDRLLQRSYRVVALKRMLTVLDAPPKRARTRG